MMYVFDTNDLFATISTFTTETSFRRFGPILNSW